MQKLSPKVSTAASAGLTLGALGVVFGDIGTSPLYALRECLNALPAGDRSAGILGALSLVFWALIIVVCLKYLLFVMKADNRGEGGIFALLALTHADRNRSSHIGIFTLLVLFGAALLYGDGVITPAISVLGAVEGLKSFAPERSVLLSTPGHQKDRTRVWPGDVGLVCGHRTGRAPTYHG